MQHRTTFTKLAIALGAFLAATTSQNVDASSQSGVSLDIAAGAELWRGDTTYQIGGEITLPTGESGTVHFPLSELEWPLDMWMAGIDLGLHLGNSFTINGALKKNMSDPDDPMKDSDWGVYQGTSPNDLVIYSESDITSFDATIYDLNAEWTIARPGRTAISIGVGHMKQEFEYEASLNYQDNYFSGYRIYGDDRTAIIYDITYTMTYVLVGFDVQLGPDTKVETQFAYAPKTDAEDEDHHRLRENGGKISKGDMDDKAYMLEVSFRHDFTPMYFVEAGAHFTKIEVEGYQTQVYGNGQPLVTIEEKSESTQLSEFLRFGIAL